MQLFTTAVRFAGRSAPRGPFAAVRLCRFAFPHRAGPSACSTQNKYPTEPIIHDAPGSGRVCPETGQEKRVQRRTDVSRPDLSPDADARAEQVWEEFTRWHAPRGRVRCDVRTESGAWAHSYDDEVRVTAAPPQGPYAIYLADRRGRFKFVVFDLDAKAVGAEQVRTDAAFLAEYLDDAGLAYLVAASGSAGVSTCGYRSTTRERLEPRRPWWRASRMRPSTGARAWTSPR